MKNLFVLLALCPALVRAETAWLDTLDLSHVHQGFGEAQTNQSMRQTPLSIGGEKFERGVGTHAVSRLWLELGGQTERFSAKVGVDDAAGGPASVVFRIFADGRKQFDSGVMRSNQPPRAVEVNLSRVQQLLLEVKDADDGIGYDHADWVDARFEFTGAAPRTVAAPIEPAEILTPPPGPAPRINGPTVYGCRPGRPFLYRVPVQGNRPMKFSAHGLPKTLRLDPATGIISGAAPAVGLYRVELRAKNAAGKSAREFRILSGDTLALTPSMGWNHWYAHYDRITDAMIREAADILLSSGMADVGYEYVNIDDCWMNAVTNKDSSRIGPLRDGKGVLIPNCHFPDMKGLTDYIHSRGLKAGIYTSPGTKTCAGFAGAFGHEAQDAATFSDWGFDFLKYDWCSYTHIAFGGDPAALKLIRRSARDLPLEAHMKPYHLMGDILKQQPRDVVYNLCQYGMADVWEWGAVVGAQSWRTAGDLGFELDRIFEVALRNAEHRAWSKPGAWNDPDYIQIGWVGNARGGGLPRPCPLTPNEQYAYMSLWALMASPLVYSGDMTRLDPFTLNVLCNSEVIAVDQDPLGQSGEVVKVHGDTFLMVKDLEDGSKAVGLFNRGEFPETVTAPWAVLGVSGRRAVRDLWRQRDLGALDGEFRATVPRHGVVLVRVGRGGPM